MFNLSRPGRAQLNMPLTMSMSASSRDGENLAGAKLHPNADCTAPGLRRHLACRHIPGRRRADERPGLLNQIRSFSTVSAINSTLTSMHLYCSAACPPCLLPGLYALAYITTPQISARFRGICDNRKGGRVSFCRILVCLFPKL